MKIIIQNEKEKEVARFEDKDVQRLVAALRKLRDSYERQEAEMLRSFNYLLDSLQ